MDRARNCYDTLHPYATQTIRIYAQRLARAAVIPGMSAADYEQQLALDLWRWLPGYKPERAELATFVDRTVRNRVCDFLAAAKTSARSAERRALSLDGEEEGRRLATRLRMTDGLWERVDDVEHEAGLRHDLALRRLIAASPPALPRDPDERLDWRGSAEREIAPLLLLCGAGPPAAQGPQAGLHEYLGAPDKSKNGPVSNQRERPFPA